YMVFAYVREIVCTVICPYGLLQGVLLDRKTLVVAYDYVRGEPRGKINKKHETVHGDCVDCDLCVQVCPTGIDIREGTQLECINCTACIDACNFVMDKIDRPKNLIGFKSEEQIHDNKPFKLSKRIYGYAAVLFLLLSVFITLLVKRTDIATTILRAGGTLYQERADGTVSNLYNAELINKTPNNIHFQISSDNPEAKIEYINPSNIIRKGENLKITFFVILPQKRIEKYKSEITFKVTANGKTVSKAQTTFIAPPNL
ncbi:MAG: cytochrome c oxidase accessory protein CcoG, partial [Daejeonella sp.]|nr:cytochrome c oxidase accessory protein CcoG [Daejeonella sp.]